MANSKLDIKKLQSTAIKLRAIAHPIRIAIISLLESNAKLNVTDIYQKLGIEQAATSHHLNILKNKGLLLSKKEGKQTFYSLKYDSLIKIIECIEKCSE